MRVLQSAGFGRDYLGIFNSRLNPNNLNNFSTRRNALLADRYEATHILKPAYEESSADFFFTVGDDPILQKMWALEKGMKNNSNLFDILLAQIEEFKPDVIYQINPILFPSSFVRRLPSYVKKRIAWRAAPIGCSDISAYDLIVSNFTTLNKLWESQGMRTAFFSPSYDPEMHSYAINTNRNIDIFFTGTYARTTGHDERLSILEAIAGFDESLNIDLRLMVKKWGRLADKFLLRWVPYPISLPKKIDMLRGKPIYGRDMYQLMSKSKLVLNPATTIAGDVRGNMRCWEALGCGACMLGTIGNYPEGFEPGVNFISFENEADLLIKVRDLLNDEHMRTMIGKAGSDMLSVVWSKDRQWNDFLNLID